MRKTDLVVTALGAVVAAAGVGLLAGRLGTTSIPKTGVPLGAAAGAAALIPVAMGLVPQRFENVAFGAGLGALAAWVNMWGAGQGAQMAQPNEPRVIAAGLPPQLPVPQQTLTEAEIANMMQKLR